MQCISHISSLRKKKVSMGRIFYIIGKSASGKNYIYESLLAEKDLKLVQIILYTTRPMRSGEQNGRAYYFTDELKLAHLRLSGKLIEERVYDTVYGPWYYFTADEGQFRLNSQDYLGIGTLKSYEKIKEYFGEDKVCPLYIETEDSIRLKRAIQREEKQPEPKYAEMCRRYLADCEDFSEKKIQAAGIKYRFLNNGKLSQCLKEIKAYIWLQIAW